MRCRAAHAAAIGAVLVLGGCGGGGSSGGRTGGTASGASGASSAATTVDRGSAARAASPVVRATGHHHGPVAVLTYHVIGTPPPGAPYPGLFVSPALFARQMQALHRAGFVAVTLHRAYEAWHGGAGLPARTVVVSFDDGYQGQATKALPVLRRLGWPAVMDLEVANLHVAGGLNAREIRRMLAAGWELAAHTLTHPDLTMVDAARLRHEVAGSRAVLRRQFGVPVDFFCYPAGRHDAAAHAAVRAAGYLGATTEDPGLAGPRSDPDALPRVRVVAGESPAAVVASARGA